MCKPSDTSEESTEEDYDDSGEEEDAQDEMEPEDNEGIIIIIIEHVYVISITCVFAIRIRLQ